MNKIVKIGLLLSVIAVLGISATPKSSAQLNAGMNVGEDSFSARYCSEHMSFMSNGQARIETDYEFDPVTEKLIKFTLVYYDEYGEETIRVIGILEYHANGNLKKTTVTVYIRGELDRECVVEYDDRGARIRQKCTEYSE